MSHIKDLKKLRTAIYYLEQQNSQNLISFLNGYFLAKENKDLFLFIKSFLHKKNIDTTYNTWIEQIDYYSADKELNWFNGFFKLINEILNFGGIIEEINELGEHNSIVANTIKKYEKEVEISDLKIKKGDIIQLTDRIGDDYKNTKFYNSAIRTPSWDLFYPSKNDFRYIDYSLIVSGESISFGNVRRLFSNSIAKIKEIYLEDDTIFLFTDFFKINVKEAYLNQEFRVIPKKEVTQKTIHNYESLAEKITNYCNGITEYSTITEIINNWCFTSFEEFKKEWHNNNRDINGKWYDFTPMS